MRSFRRSHETSLEVSFELSFQRSFDASFRRSFESSDERSNALSFETSDARSNVTSFEMSYGRSYEVSSRVSVPGYFPANSETSFLTSLQGSFEERNRGVEDWPQRPVSDIAGVEWRMSGGDRRLADEGETSPQRRRDTPYRLRDSWTVRV